MKILLLIDSLDVGGAETHVEILAKNLSEAGHKITIASAGGIIYKRLPQKDIKCICLPKILKCRSKRAKIGFACSCLALRDFILRLIEREKPDIVHAHTRRTAFLAHYACKKRKMPLVVTAHALFSISFSKKWLSKWGDCTIAISDDVKNHLTKHGIPHKRIEIVPNGVYLPPKEQIFKLTKAEGELQI